MLTEQKKFDNAVRAVSFGVMIADEYPYSLEKQKELQALADKLTIKRAKDNEKKTKAYEAAKKTRQASEKPKLVPKAKKKV